MRPSIGIDFGTTNSLAAWMDDGRPVVIPNDRGERVTPSVVSFARSGEVLVGQAACNQALVEPERTVVGVKRLLGRAETVDVDGTRYKPEEIAAHVFRKLKADAETFLGGRVGNVVVTVPARFSAVRREAVREAARLAGLSVTRLVNEPTAAAVARAYLEREPAAKRTILVYDFGGGTFDATILEAAGRRCRVRSSLGDDALGGLDVDKAVFAELSRRLRAETGVDAATDRRAAALALRAAEDAKIDLSTRLETLQSLPFIGAGNGVAHFEFGLDRAGLEGLARPFVERTVALAIKAISDAKLLPADIDRLVLSGGSSRMPLVARLLSDALPAKPEARVNCEEIVAIGAAVEAEIDSGGLSDFFVGDVVSNSYGVGIEGGGFVRVIPKNEPLPARRKRVFTTVADGQDAVEVRIMQGETPLAADAEELGRFLLTGVRAAKRGEPRVAVEFAVDESDLLHVEARDLDTGARQVVVVSGKGRSDAQERGTADAGAKSASGGIDASEAKRRMASLAARVRNLASSYPGRDAGFKAEVDETLARADAYARGDVSASGRESEALRLALEAIAGELIAMES